MKSLVLKLKTFGIGILLFILSYVLLEILLMISHIHALYETLESFLYFQYFSATTYPSEHLIIIDEGDKIYDRKTYARLI